MNRLLITGATHFDSSQIDRIARLGYDVDFMSDESSNLPAVDYQAVVCNGLFLHHDINLLPRLNFIQLTSAGLDRVPLDTIKARGIKICNARGVYSRPMAEWATMLILNHFKHHRELNKNFAAHGWCKERDVTEIGGKNVAILGAGHVGQTLGRVLQSFGAQVHGYDLFPAAVDGFDKVLHIEDFNRNVADYHIVVLTLPLTQQTRHMVDRGMLMSLRPGAMLVNIARGAIIDESALVQVLAERSDLYAALDVTEQEPLPPDSQLWSLPNIFITPHNSFIGDLNNERLFDLVYQNIKHYALEK